MSIELMLLAINLNFIIFSYIMDDIFGEIFSIYILTVGAAESAIGLSIIILYYRLHHSISIQEINKLSL